MLIKPGICNVLLGALVISYLLFSCENPAEAVISSEIQKEEVDSFIYSREFRDTMDYIMGKFEPDTSSLFEEIPREMADRGGLYLRREVLAAFRQMREHAQSDGVELVIRSATRNFDYQKGIWERKWTGATRVSGKDISQTIKDPYARALEILSYSAMPSCSRHHWGTDIDLNMFENEWFESGKGLKIYTWLRENAADYGFCQPYTDKATGRTGYEMEKWHWSYTPLSTTLMKFAKAYMKDSMIMGFEGDFTADSLDIVNKYVLGVSEDCLR